jgi:hypothetical protein
MRSFNGRIENLERQMGTSKQVEFSRICEANLRFIDELLSRPGAREMVNEFKRARADANRGIPMDDAQRRPGPK